MALFFMATSLNPKPIPPPFLNPKHKHPFKLISFKSSCKTFAQSEGQGGGVKEEEPPASFSGSLSSTRTQLDLLEQLSSTSSAVDGPGYESDGSSGKLTIREQLVRLVGDRDDDFTIPLGKNLKKVSPKILTISQKRNIKRQAYLDEVSQRNDSVFFATIGAFVLVPPFIILGIAILTDSEMLQEAAQRRKTPVI
ncbi:uncharacterized protein LOC111306255 [Durio zibethinus]|uniref:Uncharacterized protein LOC111306255 n=1 Tax=Durio zibethinus TaxID=66656 RepID=A0A6P6A4G7_DURZI|nr:uncharacterized protein LOC111306255 [Durio zibethinus]